MNKPSKNFFVFFFLIFFLVPTISSITGSSDNYTTNTKLDYGAAGTNITSDNYTQRFISGEQPVSLYNSSDYTGRLGILDVDTGAPIIALLTPVSGYSTTSTSLTFYYTVLDDSPTNCSFILNGAVVDFDPSVDIIGGANSFTRTFVVGIYGWGISCTDGSGNTADSPTRTFTITAVPIPPGGGGDVGGGEGVSGVTSFVLDKDLIHVKIIQGTSASELLNIRSLVDNSVDVEVDFGDLSRFMVISEESFTLAGRESKTLNLGFFSRDNEVADVYTGKIIFKGGGTTKIINVVIEVKDKSALFDLSVDVLTKKVVPGDKVKARILAFNMGDLRNFDVLLHYSIRDFEDNVYEMKEESIKIDEKIVVVRELIVPENLDYDKYLFYARIDYQNATATSGDTFDVLSKKQLLISKFIQFGILILLIIIILIIIFIIVFIKRRKKEEKQSNMINQ